jgi:hypothetical protein
MVGKLLAKWMSQRIRLLNNAMATEKLNQLLF